VTNVTGKPAIHKEQALSSGGIILAMTQTDLHWEQFYDRQASDFGTPLATSWWPEHGYTLWIFLTERSTLGKICFRCPSISYAIPVFRSRNA
jgi:hypothetical protein